MRGLRIELRRSSALWAGLLVVVSGTAMLLLLTTETAKWPGNSTSAVLALREPLAYVWALVVGLAVLQGMRDSRAGVGELFATTSRPGWVRLGALASAVAGVVAAATLLLCLGVIGRVAVGGGFVSAGFVPLVLPVVLAAAGSVVLGLAVGRLLPHPLAVPVALVATFTVATMAAQAQDVRSPDGVIPPLALLVPVLAPPSSDLVTTSTSVDVGQIVWFVGLGVTALLLLVSRSWRGRLVALVPAGLALALAVSILPARLSDVLVTDSIAGRMVCDGPVCVSRVHQASLPAAAEVGRDVLKKLSVLPHPPTGVREDTSAMAHFAVPLRSSDIVYLNSQLPPSALTMSPGQLRLEMLAGAGVSPCTTPNTLNSREVVVRYLTAGYFNGELAELASEPHFWNSSHMRSALDEAWRAFRSQPPAEQLKRVAKAREMLLTCQDAEQIRDVLVAAR
ncbi:hypothetical protein ACFOWZ_23015 [Lentzea rhizosphaerae]|uniref:ABC-type transport system involved in multi-copper enzyme maturation, permease component n=1 Tax=Lentzea rhizosphaerae TaxID=2041025 RepID=A0ABV8BXB0_9PSEU